MTHAVPFTQPVLLPPSVPALPAASAGIDVSARSLDLHIAPLDKSKRARNLRFANDEDGINRLCRDLQAYDIKACVFEVTGRYSRPLHEGLHNAGLPAAPVNPRKACYFIKSHTACKTDKSDAKALAAMALAMPLRVQAPPTGQEQALHELATVKADLMTAMVAARQRMDAATLPDLVAMLGEQVDLLEGQIERIRARLKELIENDPALKRRAEIMVSMPGIGEDTAAALLALMPELGSGALTGKQVAALLGVAPMAKDSGEHKGKRSIRHGRAPARTALYMPALAAMRFNPTIIKFAKTLADKGKPHKVVRIAVMRKIIVMLNAMIENNETWVENKATIDDKND